MAFIFLLSLLSVVVDAAPINVLVFGDSQGDTGPTFQVVQDVLDANNIPANVVNKAVGGTLACGWAKNATAIVSAAREAFPDARDGPDFVWYTAGGNDLNDDKAYHLCLDLARDDAAAMNCLIRANARLMTCTETLLEALWVTFPKAKVGQYNYEVPCLEGDCIAAAAGFLGGNYCGTNVTCLVEALIFWQSIYVDALQDKYPPPIYTGMNLLGAVQQASGIKGASVGHPVVTDQSPRCDWTVECVHPKYGTPSATAIGTAMWDLWLSKLV